ncbi:UNVERIFIED_CONTAM: hypothetical protein GTU68_021608 [Idotea baltica]|nr:hypothetical protein [Idotea baltica]
MEGKDKTLKLVCLWKLFKSHTKEVAN